MALIHLESIFIWCDVEIKIHFSNRNNQCCHLFNIPSFTYRCSIYPYTEIFIPSLQIKFPLTHEYVPGFSILLDSSVD